MGELGPHDTGGGNRGYFGLCPFIYAWAPTLNWGGDKYFNHSDVDKYHNYYLWSKVIQREWFAQVLNHMFFSLSTIAGRYETYLSNILRSTNTKGIQAVSIRIGNICSFHFPYC